MRGWIEIHGGCTFEQVPDPEHSGVFRIKVTTNRGKKSRWVKQSRCRFPDGSPAFDEEPDSEHVQRPEWLLAPQESILRDAKNWRTWFEVRSSERSAQNVQEFYEQLAIANGLTIQRRSSLRRSQCEGGLLHRIRSLNAASEAERFSLDIFGYRGTAFWTIQSSTVHPKTSKIEIVPDHLIDAGEIDGRIRLRHPDTGQELWVSVEDSVYTDPPQPLHRELPEIRAFDWALLPAWAQFTLEPGGRGGLRVYKDSDGHDAWDATASATYNGCHVCMLEACIDSLEFWDFDPTGLKRPLQSYYVSSLQSSASLNLHIRSETGDGGSVTSLNTLGHLSMQVRYEAGKGMPPPETMAGSPHPLKSATAQIGRRSRQDRHLSG